MFKLRQLELIHWDYWSRVIVPMEANIITVVGPNGSGKTTLIDACRTLLAIDCSKDRNYHRYVRNAKARTGWLRALVDNPQSSRAGRAFFPIISEEVTLVCRIRRAGGEWQRKYAILAGDASIEDIDSDRELQWIGVREYANRLTSAGISGAMRKVLALDQGETDKLCEYSGSELRRLVFDTFGDQSVLDEYQQALRDYEEARKELEAAEEQVRHDELRVGELQQQFTRYREWRALKKEILDLESEVVPVAQISEAWESWQRRRIERRRGWQSALQGRKDERRLARALDEASQSLAAATAAREDAEAAYEVLQDERREVTAGLGEQRGLLRQRDELRELASTQKAGFDAAQVAEELATLQACAADESVASQVQQKRIQALVEQRERLSNASAGLHSQRVTRYLNALERAGIAHAVLSDRLSIIDSHWQAAIEGLLGAHRATVILESATDEDAAWRLAQQFRFRRFITSAAEAVPEREPGSVAARVGFEGPVPRWIFERLNQVRCAESVDEGHRLSTTDAEACWLTPEGFYRDGRGSRYVNAQPKRFLLGESARQAQLTAISEALAGAQDELGRIDARRVPLEARIRRSEHLLQGHDAAAELATRSQAFADAELRVAALEKKDARLSVQQSDLQGRRAAAIRQETDASKAHGRIEQAAETALTVARTAGEGWQAAKNAELEVCRGLRRLLQGAPESWRGVDERRDLLERYDYLGLSVLQIQREIEAKKNKALETPEAVQDETIELRCSKAEEELEQKRRSLKQRKDMRQQTLELVDAQRQRYINVLKASAAHYMRHVCALAKTAGIEAQTKPLHIENNDASIAQAALEITFRFDDKHDADILAGDSSGGQKVMKSMILLMALLMDEDRPAGVVFIDEPFAHLDIMNIDRVSRFLQRTQAQYIVTTPITHNANVYAPSQITLVTQKVRPGTRHAPPIGVAVRRGGDSVEAGE